MVQLVYLFKQVTKYFGFVVIILFCWLFYQYENKPLVKNRMTYDSGNTEHMEENDRFKQSFGTFNVKKTTKVRLIAHHNIQSADKAQTNGITHPVIKLEGTTATIKPYPSNEVTVSPTHKTNTISVVTENHTSGSEPLKTILLWNKMAGSKDFRFGFGRDPFIKNKCKVNTCTITNNRVQTQDATAIVFHKMMSIKALPKKRYPNQVYVEVIRESPTSHGIHVGDAMNLVMSYRRDSDFWIPVTKLIKLDKPLEGPYIPKHKFSERTKSVAWMVSHCHTPVQREKYAHKLAQYIDVDIVGRCGKLKCPKGKMNKCIDDLGKKYKFYLGFENSFCMDYVTEKMSRPLENDLLTIVLGGTNYSRDAPPKSVLNVLDYQSPKHLAEHLHYLSKNETAYLEYFQWKLTHEIVWNWKMEQHFCDLCEMLHIPNATDLAKRHINFPIWWAKEAKCRSNILFEKHILEK